MHPVFSAPTSTLPRQVQDLLWQPTGQTSLYGVHGAPVNQSSNTTQPSVSPSTIDYYPRRRFSSAPLATSCMPPCPHVHLVLIWFRSRWVVSRPLAFEKQGLSRVTLLNSQLPRAATADAGVDWYSGPSSRTRIFASALSTISFLKCTQKLHRWPTTPRTCTHTSALSSHTFRIPPPDATSRPANTTNFCVHADRRRQDHTTAAFNRSWHLASVHALLAGRTYPPH